MLTPPPHCFLLEVREAEVRVDATIGPVEESFALLNKHDLLFSDGNAERVDGLTYAWSNLAALVSFSLLGHNIIKCLYAWNCIVFERTSLHERLDRSMKGGAM